jgi:hypothetical protein
MFFMIFYIAFGTVTISQKATRGITAEPVIFEVLVDAPCESYLAQAMNSIQISRVVSNPTCLPIAPLDPANDINDYHAHIFCTNVNGGARSLFRFHEIFVVNEDETPAPGAQFIVSWVNNKRFREHTSQYTYKRRPSCTIGTDVCSTTQIINDCWDNAVDIDNGLVDSNNDRIYFIPPGINVATCTLNGACCPYISLTNLGICGGTAPNLCQGVVCNDNNSCTVDSCDPATGVCSYTPKTCNDNKFCTTDSCDATTGTCLFTPITCDDSNACTTDSCVEGASGYTCSNVQKVCNDNNNCTTDTCVAGTCTFTPKNCTASNFCDTNGRCDATTGNCIFDATNCTDANVCTTGEYCNRTSQACAYTSTTACGIGSDRCHYKVCDPVLGCVELPLTCSDYDTCTLDVCVLPAGTCQHTNFCTSPNPCYVGTCTKQGCTKATPQPPCPADNGTQTVGEYCTFTNQCTGGHVCSDTLFCCVTNQASGTCLCPFGQLC